MNNLANNGSSALHPGPRPSDMTDLKELNMLFLVVLQRRAQHGVGCFGLAAPARRRIRDVSQATLNGMSTFPRAVFGLNLNCLSLGTEISEARDSQLFDARRALALTVALAAWNMARQRCFHARILLGLSVRESRHLSTLPMMKLHELAEHPALLRCAFADAVGLWTRLIQYGEHGLPPTLRLLGLQPQLTAEPGHAHKSYSSRIA